MIEHWFKKLGMKVNIITDNSKQIAAGLEIIKQLSQLTCEQQNIGYDTRKHSFPLPVNSITMVDSATNFGVQLADLIASSISFIWSDSTNKYKDFQNELKTMPFFKIKGYPIQPASADYLSQDVDDSNDSSPIDFIVQNLSKE